MNCGLMVTRIAVTRVAATVLLLTASALLALVAGGAGGASLSATERLYTANAAALIDEFHGDLTVSSAQVSDIADARRVLRVTADLYVLLMAFLDFDACDTMIRNAGEPGMRFGRIYTELKSACRYLKLGSRLFTTAFLRS
jgi:hypothetical protein